MDGWGMVFSAERATLKRKSREEGGSVCVCVGLTTSWSNEEGGLDGFKGE